MNITKTILGIGMAGVVALAARAQDTTDASYTSADRSIQKRLEDSVKELEELRARLVAEKVPLNSELNELQLELATAREAFQDVTRLLTTSTLEVTNLRDDIQKGKDRSTYLTNMLAEYGRKLGSRLHVAEAKLHAPALERARLAIEDSSISKADVFEAQLALVAESLDRLDDAFGGRRFDGTAVNAKTGLVDEGTFVLVGPAAFFADSRGVTVGTSEQRSSEPATQEFTDPDDAHAAAEVIRSRVGELPVDPTLGNAHRVEGMQETFLEHIEKGGTVMWPIFGLAAIALLIALYKWVALSLIGKPSQKSVKQMLAQVERGSIEDAKATAHGMKGPAGRMLAAGLEHANEPRDLIEEIMYERVLKTRLRVNNMLPFIAICAAAAPLLGLLGTVIGIIDTFKLITEFGSSDVQMLSSGISVALITTKFGLIVAIPSLLLHAYLSRKARGIVGNMETVAVALVNELSKRPVVLSKQRDAAAAPSANGDGPALRDQVGAIIRDMLGPLSRELDTSSSTESRTG
ncbi:MAG: MotA/TolQ/ExbB proton channel family protein [Planctomycetes bacterium]|nr:MotA/TolQ/ExbB proton channel family protein [Planctomycetota bacterium]